MNPEDYLIDIARSVSKKMKRNIMSVADPLEFAKVLFVSTGSAALDWALGGGIALGKITDIFSAKEAAGKSSIGAHILAETQRKNGIPILIDPERGSEIDHLTDLGVSVDRLLCIGEDDQPLSVEDVFSSLDALMDVWKAGDYNKDTFSVALWDSVTATPTVEQLEAGFGDRLFASQARVLSGGFQKITQKLADMNMALVMINQARTKMNVRFGDNTEIPGGRAPKFYASQRIRLSVKEQIKDKHSDEVIGVIIVATVVKNKVSRPFRSVKLHLYFDTGISSVEGWFELGLETHQIEKDGGWYSVLGEKKKIRRSDFEEHLTDDVKERLWKTAME